MRTRVFTLVALVVTFALVAGFQQASESADQPTSEPAKRSFVVIGDFGCGSPDQEAVVAMIKEKLKPDFIVTVGDNNYSTLTLDGYDAVVGKYFHEYIGEYEGKHGKGSPEHRFFPAIGNHDWDPVTGYGVYVNYFSLPGNERYYDFTQGNAHFFMVNSDPREPGGRAVFSVQYNWLKEQMTKSEADWKFVFMHHPPYSSSSTHGSEEIMRWPYGAWGAHAVFAGHDHIYERLDVEGTPYFITGTGGMSLYPLDDELPETRTRQNNEYGAMRVTYDDERVVYEFWSVRDGGTLIDTHVVERASESNAESEASEPAQPTATP